MWASRIGWAQSSHMTLPPQAWLHGARSDSSRFLLHAAPLYCLLAPCSTDVRRSSPLLAARIVTGCAPFTKLKMLARSTCARLSASSQSSYSWRATAVRVRSRGLVGPSLIWAAAPRAHGSAAARAPHSSLQTTSIALACSGFPPGDVAMDDLPIDINYQRLVEWMVGRHTF